MSQERSSSQNMFVFTWSIENFNMCLQQFTESLKSPVFILEVAKDAEFILRLYPRGKETENNAACFLERVDDYLDEISLSFEILVVDNKHSEVKPRKPELEVKFNDINKSWQSQNISRLVLPRDTINLKCCIWLVDSENILSRDIHFLKSLAFTYTFTEESNMIGVDGPIGETITSLKKKYIPLNNQIFACTRIAFECRSFEWSISDFPSCIRGQKLGIPLTSFTKRAPPLMFVIYSDTNSTDDEMVKIEFHMAKQILDQPVFVRCKLTVVGSPERTSATKEDHHYFKTEKDVWSFPLLLTKDMLTTNKILYLPNDTLTMKCELNISCGVETSFIEEACYKLNEYQNLIMIRDGDSRNLKTDFSNLHEEQTLSDVTFKIEQQPFSAHKAVLCARSDVFKAMLSTNMKEKDTNFIKIKDMEADVFKAMLKFMYTDTVNISNIERAIKLYSAADKYQITNLKEICCDFIKSNMSLNNLYEVLLLSDMHDDTELKSIVLDNICVHKSKVLNSERWKEFSRKWPRIARTVLYKVCLKLPDM